MDIRIVTYFLNGSMMIVMPVGLAIYLTRRYKISWRLFWVGAATFIFSQLLHIPFNLLVNPIINRTGIGTLPEATQIVISASFLGLSAGLFEELSRYGMYRWFAKDARTWATGLLVGAGHGGVEAIILGVIVLYGYIQMIILKGADLTTVLPAGQIEAAQAQITAYWSQPVYITILGAVERAFAIPLHLACSLLVLQSFTRRHLWWLSLAILLHALADAVAVLAQGFKIPVLNIEGIIGVFAVISVILIFLLRQPEPIKEIAESNEIPSSVRKMIQIEESGESLEKTKYQ